MRFELKFRLCLWKAYLDQGIGLTYYFKYLILLFGIMSADVGGTVLAVIIYAIFCFFLGRWWYKTDWAKASIEVSNQVNLFVQQMRESLNRKT